MAEYPRMIYHVNLGQKIVKSTKELNSALKKGWSMSPVLLSEVEGLRVQIKYYEEQLAKAQIRLAEITGEIVLEEEVEP